MHRSAQPSLFSVVSLLLVLPCLGLLQNSWGEEELICRDHHHFRAIGSDLEGDGRRYAPRRLVDVTHIRIEVTPDFKQRTVSGTTRIEFKPIAKSTDVVELDAMRLSISNVRSSHTVARFSDDGKRLTIVFEKPIEADVEAYVEIDYSAQPTKGLYFRTPEMGYPDTDTHVWTQGEPYEARHWFPCFDSPNERSSTEVICHVPKEMTVLSNGRMLADEITSEGLRRVQWLQEKPHTSYLICLVAGNLKKLEKSYRDIPLRFFVQPSLAEHAANSFEDTDKIMEFFESEIGVPFPWDKYDQVTIRDFIAGGMENTTLTTLTHGTIFTKATENLRTTRRLDAHELAHQWFGDYVTCKDWSQLWLNEGFATYYTHLYEGHKLGEEAMLYGLYQDAQNRVLPQQNDKKAIVYREFKNPGEQFDYRAYPKGSWVLHMLRSQLGPDLYRSCIRHYLQKHALQSVVSDDLRQAIEDLSGRPFDRFFDQWVYHPGSPELEVQFTWQAKTKLAKISVKQQQKTDNGSLPFEFPVTLRFVVNDENIDKQVEINATEHEFYFPLDAKPTVVRFDPKLTVLAKVNFNKTDAMWLAQLERDDDMLGRLLAAKALGSRDTHESIKHLKETLNNDSFYGVRIQAAESLKKIGSDEAYDTLVASAKQSDARVRRTVVSGVSSFYKPETFAFVKGLLKSETNPEIRSIAIRELGKFNDKAAKKLIVGQLEEPSFRNAICSAAIRAVEAQRDPKLAAPLMRAIKKQESGFSGYALSSALRSLARVSREAKRPQPKVRAFLEAYLADPRQAVQRGAIQALGELRDPTAIAVLEGFRDAGPEETRKAAVSAIEKLQEVKPVASREIVELRKELTDLRKSNDDLSQQIEQLKNQFEATLGNTDRDTAKEDAETDEAPTEE